jgi:hypothetical protein
MFSPIDGNSLSPVDPHYESTKIKEKGKSRVEEQKCNPTPSFSLPKKEAPKQGIIPSGLLRKAQEMHSKKGNQEAFLNSQQSEKLSEEMRRQRMKTFFSTEEEKN